MDEGDVSLSRRRLLAPHSNAAIPLEDLGSVSPTILDHSPSRPPSSVSPLTVATDPRPSEESSTLLNLGMSDNDNDGSATRYLSTTGLQQHGDSSVQVSAKDGLFSLWFLECCACVFSTAAVIAMFTTLFLYSDRPSPDWPRWLSVNTVLAIYGLILKSGVLLVAAEGLGQLKWSWFASAERPLYDMVKYDDATRSAYGAGVLLWRIRAHHVLTSLGALITILALVLDPFVQQLIHYHECDLPAPVAAHIARTNFFVQRGAVHTGANLESITPGVQNALNAGVFNPQPFQTASCSTGNCTWTEAYSTVAFCSSCQDVSELLVYYDTPFDYGGLQNTTNHTTAILGGGISASFAFDLPIWEYAAMGPVPKYQADLVLNQTSSQTTWIDFLLSNTTMGSSGTGLNDGADQSCNNASTRSLWTCRGFGASRCGLYPCVKTFNASMKSGKLVETLQETSSEWGFTNDMDPIATLDTRCMTEESRRALSKHGYYLENSQRWLAFNTGANSMQNLSLDMVDPRCLFFVSMPFLQSFSGHDGYLSSEFFNGVITGHNGKAAEQAYTEFGGSAVIKSLFNFRDVTANRVNESFANISTSLTDYMRVNGLQNYSATANGTVFLTKTCIGVRWPWMTFPSVLLCLSLAFFASILREARPNDSRPLVWKSSPLPLMYYGPIDLQPHSSSRDDKLLVTVRGMQEHAKQMKVQLGSAGEGLSSGHGA